MPDIIGRIKLSAAEEGRQPPDIRVNLNEVHFRHGPQLRQNIAQSQARCDHMIKGIYQSQECRHLPCPFEYKRLIGQGVIHLVPQLPRQDVRAIAPSGYRVSVLAFGPLPGLCLREKILTVTAETAIFGPVGTLFLLGEVPEIFEAQL